MSFSIVLRTYIKKFRGRIVSSFYFKYKFQYYSLLDSFTFDFLN